MPRLGFTYTPKGNRTAIRGGYGLFYDWYEASLYDQTLRVNGVDQRDMLILNPGYPDALRRRARRCAARWPHSGRSGLEDADGASDVDRRRTAGDDRISTTQISYQMLRGRNQMRSLNINQPVPTVGVDESGAETLAFVRPDPTVGNITEFDSTGRSNSDRADLQANYRIPQKAIFFGGNYTLGPGEESRRQRHVAAAGQPEPGCRMGFLTAGHPASLAGDTQCAAGMGHPYQHEPQRAVGSRPTTSSRVWI